jgi:hypothetical protein
MRKPKPTISSEANGILRKQVAELRKQARIDGAELGYLAHQLNVYQAKASVQDVYTRFEDELIGELLQMIFQLTREMPKTTKGRSAKTIVKEKLKALGIKKIPRQFSRKRGYA